MASVSNILDGVSFPDSLLPIDLISIANEYPLDVVNSISASTKKTLLVIGTATNGVKNVPVKVNDVEKFAKAFGGFEYVLATLTQSSSSTTLSHTPDGLSCEVYVTKNAELVPYYLDSLEVSGTSVTFAAPGETKDIYFKYIPKDVEESSDSVVRAIREAGTGSAYDLYALRIGGSFATTSIGDLVIRSVYPGEMYNTVEVIVSGSTITIGPPVGEMQRVSYLFNNLTTLVDAINRDAVYGKSPIVCATSAPFASSLPEGTYTLIGGSDGSIDGDTIREAFDIIYDLEVDVVVFAGATDDKWYNLMYELSLDLEYPTMIVLSAPKIEDVDTYAQGLYTYRV